MPRAYPKEAFAIGTNPTTGNAPPSGITNPVNTPPPSTHQGYNMNQPISTPQFYNPQAFGAAPPVSTPIPSGNQGNFGVNQPPSFDQSSQSVSYATTTTNAVAPTLQPLPQTDLTSTFSNPNTQHVRGTAPPTMQVSQTNQGPRHAPPPTSDNTNTTSNVPSHTPPTSLAPASKVSMVRGKRPIMESNNPSLGSRSPTLAEYGGHMPQAIGSPATNRRSVDPATSSLAPSESYEPDSAFVTTTLKSWPSSVDVLDKTGLPFAITFHPLAESGNNVPVVNFPNDCGIIRCKRCRSYVNPYVTFINGGKNWKCNLCYFFNDVPAPYFSTLGLDGLRYDHKDRPELNHSVVDFVASSEFMNRPPQAPIYVFVIDVCYTAVASGMVKATCNAIFQAIKTKLSKNERTKVGFITFDSAIHFYNLKAGMKSPQMLVIPEIETPFAPHPDDLLVNLNESMPLIEKLLTKLLPDMFQHTQDPMSALGPALHSAYKLMATQGGKMVVFQSVIPTSGPGKLPNRQSTIKDDTGCKLLQPGDQYYKNLALELSKSQIGCDLFFFTPKYIDVATISCMAKYTGGEVNHYFLDNFASNEVSRLQNDIFRTLTRNTGFEALMRIRCSKGISIDSHHGSFFLRAQDLLTLPNVDSDKSYTIKLKISDPKNYCTTKNLAKDGNYYATVQAGLLYTTFNGERRIRIVTKCCQITDQVSELYRQVDERASMNVIAKLAMEKAILEGIPKATQAIKSACSNILAKYALNSGGQSGGAGSTLMLPNTLLKFPLYCLAIVKNAIFRAETPVDQRITMIRKFESFSDVESGLWIHPNLYNLAAFTSEIGVNQTPFVMPPVLNLSSEKLDQKGIFLLDDGQTFLLWVGSAVDPNVLQSLFNIQSLSQVDPSNSQLQIVRLENELSQRVNNVLDRLRSGRTGYTWLYPMKEKDPYERRFFCKLIEDRFPDSYSYREFVVELKNAVNSRR